MHGYLCMVSDFKQINLLLIICFLSCTMRRVITWIFYYRSLFYTRRYLCTRNSLTCIISYVYTCTIAFTCKWTFINPRTFILVHYSFSTCHPGRHANAEQLGRHRCLCRTILWNHLSEKTCPMLNCRKMYATPTRLPHQSDNQRSKLQRSPKPELKRMKRWPMHMDQPNITKVGDHLELVSHAHMIACPQICEKGPRPIKKSLDLRTICLWVRQAADGPRT